jgi:hypothetical protein
MSITWFTPIDYKKKNNMKNDIDNLIQLMRKYTTTSTEGEIGEQGEAPAGGATGGGSKNNVTTWSQIVGANLKRGKANPIANTKWESGLTRGPANQLT